MPRQSTGGKPSREGTERPRGAVQATMGAASVAAPVGAVEEEAGRMECGKGLLVQGRS